MPRGSFQYRRFLVEMFGSVQGVLSFCRSYDVRLPGAEAVQKWFSRESIPPTFFAVLLAYLEIDRGGPISLIGFLGEPS
jgi:hypothetical protein